MTGDPPGTAVSLVLGTYNRLSFLKLTVRSVRQELRDVPHEIIIVDGGSTDGTLRWLWRQKDIITIIQHNHGTWMRHPVRRRSWGYFMNLAFKTASGKYVCMLSDDCIVVPGAIANGYRLFEEMDRAGRPVAALAFYWRDWPTEKRYRVGFTLGGKLFVNHGLYSRRALEEVGFVDEDAYGFYHADGDLCLKMWQAGYTCEASPDSYIEHYSHANVRVKLANLTGQQKDWQAYLDKWRGVFYDPTKNAVGGWIEKSYVDPHSTARAFQAVHLLNTIKRTAKVLIDIRGMPRRIRKLFVGIRDAF